MKVLARILGILTLILSGCGSDQGSASKPPPETRVVGEIQGAPLYRREILSQVFTMNEIYKSMQGPLETNHLQLGASGPESDPELFWLIGFEGSVREPDGETRMSPEFLCHTNLDSNPASYQASLPTAIRASPRLFTLSQGQLASRMPEGFGVPINSNEPLRLDTQALNHSVVGTTVNARHRLAIDFVKDSDLKTPLRPLIQQNVFGYVLMEGKDGHYGMTEAIETEHPGCLPGTHAEGADARGFFKDGHGRKFSSFWMVPPGRHTYRSRVLDFMMKLPYDTTIHYAVAHLHPLAESLELRDLTTGQTLIKTKVRQAGDGRFGIEDVERFSSVDGIPIFHDHEYELIAIYDNTTGENHDSMAVMYLYVLAEDFPDQSVPAHASKLGNRSIQIVTKTKDSRS